MSNETFDPFKQTFFFVTGDGSKVNITMDDLNEHVQYNVKICINYASQLGACLMLLIVLLLLTKREKRLSPVFLLNAASLFVNVCRMFTLLMYFTTAWSNLYAFWADDFSRVPRLDYATSVASIILTFLVLILVEVSLILQVQVVCATLRDIYRYLILAASVVVALVAIGFRFAMAVMLSQSVLKAIDASDTVWIQSATNIAITTSICFFCAIFCTKLGIAIYQRRALGLKRFGAMQIIFIMGCQTMIVPAVFAVLQYHTDVPEFGALVLTIVTISLPLSSVWAAATVDRAHKERSNDSIRRKLFNNSWRFGGSTGVNASRKFSKYSDNHTIHSSTTKVSNSPMPSPGYTDNASIDKDLEKAGIRVGHMFGMSNDEK